jgi:hypothetical protein
VQSNTIVSIDGDIKRRLLLDWEERGFSSLRPESENEASPPEKLLLHVVRLSITCVQVILYYSWYHYPGTRTTLNNPIPKQTPALLLFSHCFLFQVLSSPPRVDASCYVVLGLVLLPVRWPFSLVLLLCTPQLHSYPA